MGDVYMAEQLEPFRRTVALKVIKRGMDTKRIVARFESERQALALMDHPCIATVFDAGCSKNGRPYFAMEYVKGTPITAYCDEHKLSVHARLELFTQLCEGVQHAHQKAIIHRDLKPSNVLVMIQNDKPVPKIIDFGVAKATAQKLTESTMYTAFGEMIGTPEYMSPEQAAFTSEGIDTRTDVYALGVILYELLAGSLPFEPTELRKSGFEGILHVIREQDPPRPSTKVGTLGARETSVAQARRTIPSKLTTRLRGDLDWITMKALEKDPIRRYGSAMQLAEDVRRHLRHEPVLAGSPSAMYRIRKYVRRHRVGVATGFVVVLSLAVATVVSIVFALRAAEQQRLAATERDTARAVNEFLNEDLLAAVAPSAKKGKGKDVLMRDVLDQAAERIDEAASDGGKFEGKPLVEAAIRRTLGWTYERLGEYRAAEPHLELARDLRLRELGEEHPETLESMTDLAWLYRDQGRNDDAEPLQLKTLEVKKRVLGEEHPSTLRSVNALGWLYRAQGRLDEAEPLYLEALEIQKRVLGEEHRSTLRSMTLLADLARMRRRYEDAERRYLSAVETQTRVLGETDPLTVYSMRELAHTYQMQDRYEDAEQAYLKTLEIQRRVLGEEHQHTLWSTGQLALVYIAQERYDEAEPLLLETIEIQKRVLGEEHGDTPTSMGSLARAYMEQERYEDAELLYLNMLEIHKRVRGEEHQRTLWSAGELALVYIAQERYDVAEPLLQETLEIQKRVLGEEHRSTVTTMVRLGDVFCLQRRFEEARALETSALRAARRVWPDGGSRIGDLLGKHGATLIELGLYEDAEAALLEGHEILSASSDNAAVIEQVESFVKLYEAWNKPDKAAEWRAKLAEEQETVAKD
jgi:non-specific serine/threonine protein kinase/serine/threonine-protein kinase